MKTGSYRTIPAAPELRAIRTPSAWPLTFTAQAHFGAASRAAPSNGR
jgi:hypothetical protein